MRNETTTRPPTYSEPTTARGADHSPAATERRNEIVRRVASALERSQEWRAASLRLSGPARTWTQEEEAFMELRRGCPE